MAPWKSDEVHLYCICACVDPPYQANIQLPLRLQEAIDARQSAISKKIRFSYCDVKEISSGVEEVDVMIFPNMVQYKGLTASDIESFVEEVVVGGNEWTAKRPDKITRVHVFVCARSVVGENKTPLSDIFKNQVVARGIDKAMVVTKCTHIYGEKYTGNVVIYTRDRNGEYTQDCWCDYVTERNVPLLLDLYLCNGMQYIEQNWRHVERVHLETNEGHSSGEETQNDDDLLAGHSNGGDAQNADDLRAGEMRSFSGFPSWLKENVPWASLAAICAVGALIGFSLSRKSK